MIKDFKVILYLAIISIYLVVGYINSYVYDLKGASKDAEYFHELAVGWMLNGEWEFQVNSQFYAQFLGLLYRLTTPTEFIAVLVNISMLLLAAVYADKIMKEYRVDSRYRVLALFLISLWPSMIPRAAAAMREPIMIGLMVILFYQLMQIYKRKMMPSFYLVTIPICCYILFSIHKAYAILLVVYISLYLLALYADLKKNTVKGITVSMIAVILLTNVAILVYFLSGIEVPGLRELNALVLGDTDTVMSIMEDKSGIDERASYGVALDFSSVTSLIKTYPLVVGHYVLQPFPTRITNFWDIYAFFEVIWRVLAMIWVFKYRKKLDKSLTLLLILYLFSTCMWAAGTTNYGTASRHHLTSNWMLILLFFIVKYGKIGKLRTYSKL